MLFILAKTYLLNVKTGKNFLKAITKYTYFKTQINNYNVNIKHDWLTVKKLTKVLLCFNRLQWEIF